MIQQNKKWNISILVCLLICIISMMFFTFYSDFREYKIKCEQKWWFIMQMNISGIYCMEWKFIDIAWYKTP